MFLKIYGGGPVIKREKPYIYSAAVEDMPAQLNAARGGEDNQRSNSNVRNKRFAMRSNPDDGSGSLKRNKTQQINKQALDKLPI